MSAARIFALVLLASLSGWLAARNAIASDCERLGTFYDGRNTHHCSARTHTINVACAKTET